MPKISAESFGGHIEKISRARRKTDELIDKSKTPDICSSALDAAWEAVFDWLCSAKNSDVDLADLNTAAGIIQKLASSKNSLRKSDEDSGESAFAQSPRRLDETQLKKLEEELKLL